MSDASMMMHACIDTVIHMLVCQEATDACYSAHHAALGPLPMSFKNVDAFAVSQRSTQFKCPLGALECTSVHSVPVPPSKPGSAKAEYVIDTKTILSCLAGALQRGAWQLLANYVVVGTFRALRINITVDTIVDYEDETNSAPVEHQVKKLAALSDKGRLAAKTTALVRQAVEDQRARSAQTAHICVAVAGQMARYRLSMK